MFFFVFFKVLNLQKRIYDYFWGERRESKNKGKRNFEDKVFRFFISKFQCCLLVEFMEMNLIEVNRGLGMRNFVFMEFMFYGGGGVENRKY